MSTYYQNDNFWLNKPSELYSGDNFLKIIPNYNMPRYQQLNAITRFLIYFFFIGLILGANDIFLYFPILGIVFITILYYINNNDTNIKINKYEKIQNIRKNITENINDRISSNFVYDGEQPLSLDTDSPPKFLTKSLNRGNNILESGYVDSEGDIIINKKQTPYDYNSCHDSSLITLDEVVDYQNNTCRKPTLENPLMNPHITEYNGGEDGNDFDGDFPAACNVDDEDIKENIRVNFNHNLFRDLDEVWERENSQRQFYTLPNTAIPNNQVEFAKYLYHVPATCKEDNRACLLSMYEDLRFKR